MILWQEYTEQQKVQFIARHIKEPFKVGDMPQSLTEDLVRNCILSLGMEQRKQYMDYITTEASNITYNTPNIDVNSPEATNMYYWVVHTMPASKKAEKLWNVLVSFEP